MHNLPVQVGERIRILRKNRGLTQEQLGEMVQLPQSYIGGIERGEKNISLGTLERIILALDIRPEEVLTSNTKKDDLEKHKIIDKINLLLHNREHRELSILHNLVSDVLKAFDSHH